MQHVWEICGMHTVFWWEYLKGRNHLDDLGVNEKTILEWILEMGCEGVDWIHLAPDRDHW
jgi:hypothetical protein